MSVVKKWIVRVAVSGLFIIGGVIAAAKMYWRDPPKPPPVRSEPMLELPTSIPERSIFVFPPQNASGQAIQNALGMGLGASLTEMLGQDPHFIVTNGLLVLTADQVKRVFPETMDKPMVLKEANAVARAAGAEYFLSGEYHGPIDRDDRPWTLTMQLYQTQETEPMLLGTGNASGRIFLVWKDAKNKTRSDWSTDELRKRLVAATIGAFTTAKIVLPQGVMSAFDAPWTKQFLAFKKMAEALRYAAESPTKKCADDKLCALSLAENVVYLDPKWSTGVRSAASIFDGAGRIADAEKYYRDALTVFPNDVNVLLALARIALTQEQFLQARDMFQRVIDLRPKTFMAQLGLGQAYVALRQEKKAVEAYLVAKAMSPDVVEVRSALVRLYLAQKDWKSAEEELRVLVEKDPENIDVVLMLGACLRASGDTEGAKAVYAAGAARFSKDSRLPKFAADLALILGDKDSAKEFYTLAQERNPKDPRPADALAHLDEPEKNSVLGGPALLASLDLVQRSADAFQTDAEIIGSASHFVVFVFRQMLAEEVGSDDRCARALPAYYLTRLKIADYEKALAPFDVLAERVGKAGSSDELAAFTADEVARFKTLLVEHNYLRDIREWKSVLQNTVQPILDAFKCEVAKDVSIGDENMIVVGDKTFSIDDIKKDIVDVMAANHIPMREIPKFGAPSSISPLIPMFKIPTVHIIVSNDSKDQRYMFMVDDHFVGIADPGKTWFEVERDWHLYCLLPVSSASTAPFSCNTTNVRQALFTEGKDFSVKLEMVKQNKFTAN